MNKILNFILTPIIAILLVVVKIPSWEEKIKTWHQYAPQFIIGFLIIATIYNYYITVVSPYKTLQNIKKKRWEKIDEAAEILVNALPQFELSLNIMIPKRKILSRIEPDKTSSTPSSKQERKFRFFPKVFDVVWGYGSHRVNSKLKFTTRQGSCGKAYEDEEFYGFDIEAMKVQQLKIDQEFNLNTEQMRLTEKIMMVASCPIIHIENTPEIQKATVVGVLNVESRVEKSGELISDPEKRAIFYSSLNDVAKAYLYSHY